MAQVPQQQVSKRPKWDAFKYSFKQSNYITDFWTWLLTLLSKSAELVLFGSILYSSYQLVPGVPSVPPAIDAFLFLVQQAALDIGGMGLLKLAKRAGLSKDSFPMRVGVTLVVLMILNVVLATIKHALPMVPESVFIVIEALLLIARATMAVLFGHAIHALREEYGESTITIKDANELQQQLAELSAELSRVQHNFQQRLPQQLSQIELNFQQRLASELSPVHESFQQYQDVLALIPTMKAQLQHIESSTLEEVRRVKASLEKQLQSHVTEREMRGERPVLRALPSIQQGNNETRTRQMKERREVAPQGTAGEKFDARAFVFACLQGNPELKLSEIERLALSRGQELSQPTASRYRKQFFGRGESSPAADYESSTMKAESPDESSTMKAESRAVGQ